METRRAVGAHGRQMGDREPGRVGRPRVATIERDGPGPQPAGEGRHLWSLGRNGRPRCHPSNDAASDRPSPGDDSIGQHAADTCGWPPHVIEDAAHGPWTLRVLQRSRPRTRRWVRADEPRCAHRATELAATPPLPLVTRAARAD